MCGWVIDVLRLQVGAQLVVMINPEHQTSLKSVADLLDVKKLHLTLDYIYDAMRNVDATLNKQMTLERLLLALIKSRRRTQ